MWNRFWMQPGPSHNSWSVFYFADPALSFLLSNIQDPKISSITALAISSICMSCYSQMTEYFDVLAQVKNVFKSSLLVQVIFRPVRIIVPQENSFAHVTLTLTRLCILKAKESGDSREEKKRKRWKQNKTTTVNVNWSIFLDPMTLHESRAF